MRRIAVLVQVPMAIMVLYLDILAIAAAMWRRTIDPAPPRARFGLLIPAHDEEILLPRLLDSCRRLDYPEHLFDMHVIADNCADRTAAVARAGGATVHERCDERQRGKGYALRWILGRIDELGLTYDGYVILDADTVVSTNLLAVFNAYLARGDQAIQCFYGVLNYRQSWLTMMRYMALLLFNGVRPRGRDVLGLSAGLRGNGMCFAAPLMQRFGWDAFTLTEDAEFHLLLVDAGIRVAFAGEACVRAEMPTSLRQARSQNLRWERGRLRLVRAHGPRLFMRALGRGDPRRIDALAELLVPPLSVLMGVSLISYIVTAGLRLHRARQLAGLILLGQVGYVVGGLRLTRAEPRAYAALFIAPFYALWKVSIYLFAAFGPGGDRWVRTERRAAPSSLPPSTR